MMKLTDAVKFSHRTSIYNAHRNGDSFKGHISAFDDNSRDSLSTQRRIMSTVPGVVIPEQRIVKIGNQHWIVGNKSEDLHGEEILRRKYVLHRAEELAKVSTFEQYLTGTGSRNVWASRLLVKEMKEPDESSELHGTYNIYTSKTEKLSDPAWATGAIDGRENNVVIEMEGHLHLVRTSSTTVGGFGMAIVDELPNPVSMMVDIDTVVYNRATDTKTPTTTNVKALLLRWQSKFVYLASYSPEFQRGDANMVVLKSAVTPKAGDVVRIYGNKFRVVTVYDQGAVWAVHIRHD